MGERNLRGPLTINSFKLRHERIVKNQFRILINLQINESLPGRAIFCVLSKSEKEIFDFG